ncbi:signal peptidase II [Auraticoccus sp. F435]|uniref:Lipoprotein signal peptidase n=1 Tax=Auraticoccus cholistanensis TaxID=2656650 RepID=A0A6A9UZ66_9ACTN|nr:signal peptidase II [Auraticoccus cholistanensis]
MSQSPPPRHRIGAGAARLLFVATVVVGYGLDLLTKQLVLARLREGEPERLLGGLLTLRLIFNPGAAFGLGQGATIVFSLLSIAVLVGVLVGLLPRIRHRGWALALGLLTAGVCGNLTDRLVRPPAVMHGHVVDFLQIPYFPAIFNVADVCVTVAAFSIAAISVFGRTTMSGEPVEPERTP